MTLKQMAALNVAKLVAFALAVGLVVNVSLHYFGLATVGLIMAIAVLAYMIKFMYDIEVSKLESKNALTKIKESK
jgi:high-affinity Fe2+/Pb2+ permease